ncbi:MAG: T9SS type A sorting domain-containing protein [Bacteroidetes bacterium]|jgi:parallel beta-helix repeat protein|nr:T9SS type A sorting domain-containing protein [Bacteroidota bacterium]MBT3749912.1 T9SS type A sorting domain-containing protein [Bacteroidota bacterium]MBT4401159.1 T9SS type A sorting domain-containing protein [Bacteroidota bacterium]MBT4411206.1 T9SS type A sorting domain-containing protein [Bacteroidota bacterium]MBT7463737.1 T9SS type A sorting domain-containing protein [Bacteroidota bacterium]
MKRIILSSILVFTSIYCTAKVLEVPGDFQSISEAIAAASNLDTILVAQGTYYENLNFSGKDIVMASHYIFTKDLRDIENTIIDGSSPTNPDSASCLILCSGESRTAVIEGFTITNGSGSDWIDPQFPSYTWHSGGGILIYQSSPTIRNNIIIGNHCDDDTGVSGASGGGILTYGGNPIITKNKIQYNSARYGAGIVIDYSGCVIKNNIISNNKGPKIYGGAAFWTIGNGSSPAIIENNTIINNETTLSGGAFYIWSSQLIARNNIIWGNKQGNENTIHLFEGGAIDISYSIVEGGYEGTGNMDIDPEFSGPMLELTPGSPCVDAGNPGLEYNDIEDPQNPGMALSPALGTTTNDMGVFGGPNCLIMTNNTSGLNDKAETQQTRLCCFPNPFSDQTEIQFKLERSSNIELVIIDMQGRTVRFLDKGFRSRGTHSLNWNGSDSYGTKLPAGIYYPQLNVNQEFLITEKIVIFQ